MRRIHIIFPARTYEQAFISLWWSRYVISIPPTAFREVRHG